jgi:long-chain acyl-CoA synthetase
MSLPLIKHASTLAHLLAERFSLGGDAVALHAQLPDGVFHAITWRELQISVDAVVGVLLKAGVQPSDRVAQLSENRYEWVLIDFACALLQAVHVPIHASLSGPQALEQIAHSGAKVVAVSSREQAQKLASPLAAVQDARSIRVIAYTDCGDLFGSAWLGTLSDLCRQTTPGESYEIVRDWSANITPDMLATILYTSGTTGEPKGVMLTHANLVSNATAAVAAFGDPPSEVKLNFLPLSHVFARTCDLYGWLVRGGQLVIASSREKVREEFPPIQPTVHKGVPYFLVPI